MQEESIPLPETPSRRRSNRQTVNVATGSRVHFGLLAAQRNDGPSFGGCGVMVHRPDVCVQTRSSDRFRIAGQHRDRCLKVVERFARICPNDELPRCELRVVRAAQSHAGLGAGTQIDLAVARALCAWRDDPAVPLQQLAIAIAGRARRSAVGTHGFDHGGFIAESGVDRPGSIGRLVTAERFPSQWRILLVSPKLDSPRIHGSTEQAFFSSLPQTANYSRKALWSLMVDAIVPAIRDQNYADFSAAVFEYNYRSGLLFEGAQGGPYNGSQLESLVEWIRQCGCNAVGQSSWGPTLFAICDSQDQASEVARRIEKRTEAVASVLITRARNKPASVCSTGR